MKNVINQEDKCKKIYKRLLNLKSETWLQAIKDYFEYFGNNTEKTYFELLDCITKNKKLMNRIKKDGLKKGYLQLEKNGKIKVTLNNHRI